MDLQSQYEHYCMIKPNDVPSILNRVRKELNSIEALPKPLSKEQYKARAFWRWKYEDLVNYCIEKTYQNLRM